MSTNNAWNSQLPAQVAVGGTGAVTLTANSILLGNGTSPITALGAATNGQIPIGNTGNAPTLAVPSNGTNITWTGGAGTLTANLTGTTNHAVQVGSAAGALTSLSVGTTGTVLIGSTGADPAFGALGVNSALTNHGVVIAQGNSAFVATAVGTTGQVLTGSTGADPVWASPAASSISITGNSGGALTGAAFTFTGGTTGLTFSGAGTTETLTGDLVVANGGTGNTTFTAYSVITAGTTSTGAFQNVSGVGTAGQVLTSAGAGALPTWSAASAGGTTWSVITANQTAAVSNGYFCNKAGTLTLALPAASAVGDIIEVSNINTATGCQFTQAASQQIFIGNTSTTAGATGTLTSSAIGDSLKLVCRTANLTWFVVSGWGNWTPA